MRKKIINIRILYYSIDKDTSIKYFDRFHGISSPFSSSFFFFFFLSTRASAMNLSRNACHTSLVESNGATVWRIVILLCTGRHFLLPSWATSRSDGEEGTPSIESKICKHSFRLLQTSASWKHNGQAISFFFFLSLYLFILIGVLTKRRKREGEKVAKLNAWKIDRDISAAFDGNDEIR